MPVDERTRLLVTREGEYGGVDHVSKPVEAKVQPTPLDMGQVVVLTLARISEPVRPPTRVVRKLIIS